MEILERTRQGWAVHQSSVPVYPARFTPQFTENYPCRGPQGGPSQLPCLKVPSRDSLRLDGGALFGRGSPTYKSERRFTSFDARSPYGSLTARSHLALKLLHPLIRHLKIGVDVLDIVVFFESVEQLEHFRSVLFRSQLH